MEERMVDKDDERLIRIKRTKDGVDAEDATSEERAEEENADVVFEIPEEEFDEDLVGLTPTQLKNELERRKKAEEDARAEYEKLLSSAEALIAEEKFDEAEAQYKQAERYVFADWHVTAGLWRARTKDFIDWSPVFIKENAKELSEADMECKTLIREKLAFLKADRSRLAEAEAELAPSVLEKQQERREAFTENKKYYSLRAMLFVLSLIVAAVGASVCASFIVKTLSIWPVVCTGILGGAAFILFVVSIVFLRKLYLAQKLCNTNEALSSTENGARLEALRNKIECLDLIFEDRHSEIESEQP